MTVTHGQFRKETTMQKHSFGIRGLSIFLAILIAIFVVPVSVYADALESIGNDETVENTVEEENTALTRLSAEVFEDTSLREENVKHFRLADGSYIAYAYGMPIHTRGEDGLWQDIDNTLTASGDSYVTPNARVKFAKKITGNEALFTLHDGNRKLTMSLDGAIKKTKGIAVNTETQLDESADLLQKLTTLDKLTSRITYYGILSGVDLEYVVDGVNVKENIIVKEKQDAYTYSFTLALNNLEATLLPDGAVIIEDADTGETVYTIPAPTVFDADGIAAPDGAAYYTLTHIGNTTYTLAVTVSADWMNSADRAFPVTVDPPIMTQTGSDTVDLYVISSSPNANNSTSGYAYVSASQHSYWKKGTLPPLPETAFVVEAYFVGNYTAVSASGHVGIYAVTSDFTSALTWNAINSTASPSGTVDSRTYDYISFNNSTSSNGFVFDITPLVKDWYDNDKPNYGICLKPVTGTTFTGSMRWNTSENTTTGSRPCLQISYRNMGGVESYWSTTSASAGFAGSGSVNMRLGYLTFAFGGLSTTDAILPYTPTLVYNSTSAGVNVSNEGLGPVTGYGWSADFQQRVTKDTYKDVSGTEHTYYVLRDADGSEHAFISCVDSNGIIRCYDEDGLGLVLYEATNTTNNVRYIMTTRYDEYSHFDTKGNLIEYGDAWGNKRKFERDDNSRVISVSLVPKCDIAITQLIYAYNEYGYITSITYTGSGKQLRFYYSSSYSSTTNLSPDTYGYLRRIELHSSTSSSTALAAADYVYNSAGFLTQVDDAYSNSRLIFGWSANKDVARIVEYGKDGSSVIMGQSMAFIFDPDGANKSICRTTGNDDRLGTLDDLFTHFLFDDCGKTRTTYVTNASGTEIYGTTQTGYAENGNEASDIRKNNHITEQSVTGRTQVNYLKNGSFDGGITGWVYPYVTGSAHIDGDVKAVKLVYDGSTATAPKGIYQGVELLAGTYTFSANVKLPGTEGNATVRLKITDSTGASVIAESASFTNDTAIGNVADFIPLSLTFTLTSTALYRYYIELVTESTTQELWVDHASLVKGEVAGLLSFVQNGSMEASGGWSGTSYSLSTEAYWEDTKALKLTGSPSVDAYAMQTITLMSQAEQNAFVAAGNNVGIAENYFLSGYAKADSVLSANTNHSNGSRFALQLRFQYLKADGTKQNGDWLTAEFDPHSNQWQYISKNFTTEPTLGVPYAVNIRASYTYNMGSAYFDDILLAKATEYQVYTYYDDGKLKDFLDGKTGKTTQCNYTGEDLSQATCSDGTYTKWEYDNHKVVLEQHYGNDSDDILPEKQYTYDSRGLLIGSTVYYLDEENGDRPYTYTQYTYYSRAACYGMMSTVTTATGTTKYFYSTAASDYGMLRAVIGENGNGTAYTYDALGRQITAKPAVKNGSGYTVETTAEKADMAYDGNALTSVTTNSTVYTFTYQTTGVQDGISVGGNQIARYLYNSHNGKLRYVIYGNGYVERYNYDHLDRLSSVWYYEGSNASATDATVQGYAYTQASAYTYNAEGNVAEYVDYTTGLRRVYRYGLSGNVESVTTYTLDGTSIRLADKTAYTYDVNNKLTGAEGNYLLNGNVYTVTTGVAYDSLNRIKRYTQNGMVTSYDYLPMGMVGTTISTAGSVSVEYDYTYETVPDPDIDDEMLTGRVSGVTSTVKYSNTTKSSSGYSYTYDGAGNIVEIRFDGVLKVSYEYDNLNQLVRENNAFSNKTYTYTYDNAGNITSKRTYAYTTGTVGSSEGSVDYSYSGSGWGDQLMRYDGGSITYDSLGNPLTYYNGSSYTFTWENGRHLASVVGSSYNVEARSYEYNADGIRTRKVRQDGSSIEYVLDGSTILAQYDTVNGTFIQFRYDANGTPVAMILNGVTYLYEKNLQGDIIGIYDTNGNKIVTYVYDAWGNMVWYSTTSTSVWYYNPFRYRGYYWDSETGFYYLQSRYYDPVTGRFLNADSHVNANGDLIGYNMYAYCSNNPVMCVDPSGEGGVLVLLGALAILSIACIGYNLIDNSVSESQYEHNQIAEETLNTSEPIDNQWLMIDYKYGAKRMDYNGCEIIAVYNARHLLDLDANLAQTANIFYDTHAIWLFGWFGSRPSDIALVLNHYGMEYSTFNSVNDMTQDGVYIISYWNNGNLFEGIHTVAVQVTDGKPVVFNNVGVSSTAAVSSYAGDGFIIGYYLGGG